MYYIQTAAQKTEFNNLNEAIKHLLEIEKHHKQISLMEYAWSKEYYDIIMVEIDHTDEGYYFLIGAGGMLDRMTYEDLVKQLSRVYLS